MNNEPNPKPSRSLLWRIIRGGLLILAALVTLAALVMVEETWRAKRDWEKFRAEWEAKGERMGIESLQKAIPDEQNFGMSARWKAQLDQRMKWNPETKRMERVGEAADLKPMMTPFKSHEPLGMKAPALGSWRLGTSVNLTDWQSYYRCTNSLGEFEFPIATNAQTPALDVLLALSRFDSNLAVLRAEAAARPMCHYPVHYEDGAMTLIPHFAQLKGISQYLYLRCAANLQADRTEDAFQDLQLLMRVTDSLRNEPLLIACLVHIAMMNFEMQAIWDGIACHKWSDEQLAVIDRELVKVDMLESYKNSMRGERACQIITLESIRQGRSPLRGQDGLIGMDIPAFARPFAGAFVYRNQLLMAQFETEWIHKARFNPSDVAGESGMPAGLLESRSPYTVWARMMLPAINTAISKAAFAQGEVNLARTACALERYRLANNSYPETTAELAPKFIESVPIDFIDGKPLRYRRTSDGQFVLYSVGWNQKDDGGTLATRKAKNGVPQPVLDVDKGDWVWRYAL